MNPTHHIVSVSGGTESTVYARDAPGGLYACIMASKSELASSGQRCPEEVARVGRWEALVSQAAKRGLSTFFVADTIPEGYGNSDSNVCPIADIDTVIQWAQTTRGGWQLPLALESQTPCSSAYGLCE